MGALADLNTLVSDETVQALSWSKESLLNPYTVEGSLYGLTWYTFTFPLLYNKNALAQVGLTENDIPDDWGSFENQLKEIAAAMEIPYQKAVEIEEYSRDTTSWDISVNDEGDTSMGDLIGDDKAISPEAAAAQAMLRQHIEEALSELNPKEQEVLRLRFGLNDGRERTLDEIGKKFGVTRERIRQIEAKALRKLRHPSRSKKLKDFLN